jgi:hypothetical protein
MTSAELNNRFDEFGGIPRSLFHLSQKELNDGLKQSLSETKLKDIVEKVSLADGLVRLEKTSSMLLHYDVFVSPPLQPAERKIVRDAIDAAEKADREKSPPPAWPANLPTQLPFELKRDAPIRIPTKFLQERMFEEHSKDRTDTIMEFIEDALGNPAVFQVRHQFFEQYADNILAKGGKFTVQQLQDPRSGSAGRIGDLMEFDLTVAGNPRGVRNAGELAQLAPNQYGKGTSWCQESWDAALDPDKTLQHTTGPKHTAVEGGIFDAEFELRAKFGAAASGPAATALARARVAAAAHGPIGPAVLKALNAAAGRTAGFRLKHYFCVPPDRFAEFKLNAADFKPTVNKPMPPNVDFFVLKVRDPTKKRKVSHAHMQQRAAIEVQSSLTMK